MTKIKSLFHGLFILIRYPWYIMRLNKISIRARISTNVFLRNARIGCYTYVARSVIINDTVIGNYCSIAPGSQIGAMNHDFNMVSTSARLFEPEATGHLQITEVGHNVWIGANSIIMAGVKIGNGAIIGANSFVKMDVPPYAIVFGTPAKLYKFRYPVDVIEKHEESQFWLLDPLKAKALIKNNYFKNV